MNRIALRVVFASALIWIAALTQRGLPLAVDEVEFFRATKWIGEGQMPFRDFWEHHTPLQWVVFAPVAPLIANGPGAEAIVAMRWAQMALWIAIFAVLVRIARREGVDPWSAIVLLLVSTSFIRKAIEYRVDVLGNLAYLGAVALIVFGATTKRWIAFGALMAAAVLANMRLAPLVVITALLAMFWRGEERRWRWNVRAWWMIAGVVPIAAAFVGWLYATGAWLSFVDGVLRYNETSARLLEVDTFFDALLTPLWTFDIGGIAFLMAAIAGAVLVLRKPGPLQFIAFLVIGSIATIALMEVQYDYHFQNAYLLMAPLAAFALARVRLLPLVAAGALSVFLIQALPSFGNAMEYQDAVMTTADRLTKPAEKVFDGAGFALRREPAYRYWFLTTGVRFMAARGLLEPFDIEKEPPAAIIYDYRAALYLRDFPRVAEYATTHYVPVYRNLWVPGMTAIGSSVWVVPRAGTYDLWASDALLNHPWLTKPLEYAAVEGPLATRYAIPLAKLPPSPVDVTVDGAAQPLGTRTLTLKRGSRVEVASLRRTGILLVPRGIGTLCIAPAEERVF
ncbi:MAG TPA: hypothetical protein VEK79_16425 [Thermoanaerobaculia bacterium]|nr:hypothetical protein [Thermoanaerobaculia bacterium]